MLRLMRATLADGPTMDLGVDDKPTTKLAVRDVVYCEGLIFSGNLLHLHANCSYWLMFSSK